MSDIQLPATQQLTQALNQLIKLAPQSEAARLGIEVIVKHLAGSMLNLSSPSSGLVRELSLPAKNLQGKLQDAGTYTVKVAAQQNPVLQFFSSESPTQPIKIPITPQQLQTLLKLPANQFLSGLPTPRQGTLNPPKGDVPLALKASIESLVNSQIVIKVAGQNKALPIQLPTTIAAQFKTNDKVHIELSPKGPKWQLKITSQPVISGSSGHSVSNKTRPQPLPLNNRVDTPRDRNVQNSVTASPKTHSVMIPPEQAPGLLKAALTVSNKGKTPSVHLPVQTILTQLPTKSSENVASLLNKLNQLSSARVALNVTSAGHFELLGASAKPIAQLPISRDILSVLAQIKIPQAGSQETSKPSKHATQNILPTTTNQAITQVADQNAHRVETPRASVNFENTHAKPPTAPANNQLSAAKTSSDSRANKLVENVPNTQVSRQKNLASPVTADKAQISTNQSILSNTPSNVTGETKAERLVGSPEISANVPSKGEQIKLIQTLLRVVNARAELPAETLNRIQLAVTDPLVSKESSLKELIEPLVQQIKQAVPQGKENDASQIRQLLSAPALNLSSVQLVAPPASQGLLGGLVAILQISLASRLLRNQPTQLDNITQTLGSLIVGTNQAPSSAQAARGLADFFQLEQKHQLLKEIGRLLSGHQANKLSSAEQVIQGQDTFYYTLPSAFDDKLKNIELLIRRESESQQEKSKDKAEAKSWHLTMKLGVGELGELLTKAKLRPDHLEIDFYASNEATKEQVFNFLPLLKKRLQSLGIEVAKSQCQLGKIPSTLQQRPYQVFQTKV